MSIDSMGNHMEDMVIAIPLDLGSNTVGEPSPNKAAANDSAKDSTDVQDCSHGEEVSPPPNGKLCGGKRLAKQSGADTGTSITIPIPEDLRIPKPP